MPRDIYQEVTDKVMALLEAGTVPWRVPFNTREGLHRNFQSGRPYRGINQMLLSLSGYEQPYWMTFKAMKLAGGDLIGEKGTQHATLVTFWKRMVVKCQEPACTVCHGTGAKHKSIMFLKHYNVFNIQQTTLVPPDIPAQHDHRPDLLADQAVIHYVEDIATTLLVDQAPGRAFYMPSKDLVSVPVLDDFGSVASYYGTLFHEFAHSTGHANRLARKGIMERTLFGDDDYSDEELVAEFTSAMLLGTVGLYDEDRQQMSASYIDHWRSRLSQDPKLVIHAAARAQRAADYILGIPEYSAQNNGDGADSLVAEEVTTDVR